MESLAYFGAPSRPGPGGHPGHHSPYYGPHGRRYRYWRNGRWHWGRRF